MNSLYEYITSIFSYRPCTDVIESLFNGCYSSNNLSDIVTLAVTNYKPDHVKTPTDKFVIHLSNEIIFEIIEEFGGNNEKDGLSYFKIYKFTRNDEEVYIKFDGIHRSHYGNTFHVFYRVNPVVKSVLSFE